MTSNKQSVKEEALLDSKDGLEFNDCDPQDESNYDFAFNKGYDARLKASGGDNNDEELERHRNCICDCKCGANVDFDLNKGSEG